MSQENEFELVDPPDPGISQDPGIPGFDAISDRSDRPIPDAKDEGAQSRERIDDPDREGHQTAPSGDSEAETRAD